MVAATTTVRRIGYAKQRQVRVRRSPQQATNRWVLKNCAVASMASCNASDSSRSSIPGSSDALHPAAFGWLSCRAMTPPIPTHNTTDALGIALTAQAGGLGGIDYMHRFDLQLAFALKNQVIQRRHHNRRRALLFSNKEMGSTSLSWGSHVGGYVPQLWDAKQSPRGQASFVSIGTTALIRSQQISAVASELWPAGCVDPCFN